MAKINRGTSFGGERKPALTVEHINGDATVLTVDSVALPKVGNTQKVVVTFKEFAGYSFWLNATMTDYGIAKLGDDTDNWTGERIPLHKIDVENPSTGEMVNKLYIMPPSEWADAFAEFDGGSKTPAKRAAKRATR